MLQFDSDDEGTLSFFSWQLLLFFFFKCIIYIAIKYDDDNNKTIFLSLYTQKFSTIIMR